MFYFLRSNACGSWKNQSLWFEFARSRSLFGVIWWDRYQMKAVFLYFFVLQTVLVVFTTKQHIFYKVWPTLLSQNNKIKVGPVRILKKIWWKSDEKSSEHNNYFNFPKNSVRDVWGAIYKQIRGWDSVRPSFSWPSYAYRSLCNKTNCLRWNRWPRTLTVFTLFCCSSTYC